MKVKCVASNDFLMSYTRCSSSRTETRKCENKICTKATLTDFLIVSNGQPLLGMVVIAQMKLFDLAINQVKKI